MLGKDEKLARTKSTVYSPGLWIAQATYGGSNQRFVRNYIPVWVVMLFYWIQEKAILKRKIICKVKQISGENKFQTNSKKWCYLRLKKK